MKLVIELDIEIVQTLSLNAGRSGVSVEQLIGDIIRQEVETQVLNANAQDWRAIVHEMYAQPLGPTGHHMDHPTDRPTD